MATRIVAGRAGSGKSLRCFTEIVRAMKARPLGPCIYWVVPRQATFAAERWLTCNSDLPAFSRCRVVSFEELANEVVLHAGGGKRAVVSRPGRLMILGHLLRRAQPHLRHFQRTAREPGMPAEILAFLDEVSRQGQSDALDASLQSLGDSPLKTKLCDLAQLQRDYRDFLGSARFDRDSRAEFVLRRLGATPNFRGATFHVDGFLDLTDFERRMIAGLATFAADVEVTFCLPDDSPLLSPREFHRFPDEDSVFHRTETAHRALRVELERRGVPVQVERIGTTQRFGHMDLRAVESLLAGRKTDPVPLENVRLIEADTRESEVAAAAREIRKLVDEGCRLRDVVVLVRELPDYERLISQSFQEHNLRFFMDRRRDASCHPLLRILRALAGLPLTGWTTDAIATIAKSGLAGVKWETACALEDLGISRGLRGEAWTAPHPAAPADVETARAKIVAAVAPYLRALRAEEGLTARDAAVRLLAVLDALGVRTVLADWIGNAASLEDKAEHEQVWAESTGFLDELNDLLGDQAVTAAEFESVVLAGLQGLDLGLTPPTVDQLLVGSAERTRVGDAKVALVLGLSDGLFPRHRHDAGLLSDAERAALRRADLHLDASAEQRQLDERLIAYLALTRASEKLLLFRPAADDANAPLSPSPFWTQVRDHFDAPVERALNPADVRALSTPRHLVLGLLHWARRPDLRDDPAWRDAYDAFARLSREHDGIGSLASAVWTALARRNVAALEPATAARLYRKPLVVGVDELESFAACPFQHFAAHVLRLGELEPPQANGKHVSGLMHRVLDRVCADLLQRGRNFDALDGADAARRIEQLTDLAIRDETRRLTWDGSDDLARLSQRDQAILLRTRHLLRQVLSAHRRAAGRTRFVPRSTSYSFGDARAPALSVPLTRGGRVLVRGRIDRIDATPDGKRAIAWDYRLGTSAPSLLDAYHGLTLGILVHLLVLRDAPEPVLPAGAFTVPLSTRVKSFSSLDDWRKAKPSADPEEEMRRRQGRGLLNIHHLRDLDTDFAPGPAGSPLFAVRLTKEGLPYSRSNEALTPDQFDALLDHAARKIGELAQLMLDGDISVAPYLIRKTTPCTTCGFNAVCRFDLRAGGRYRPLDASVDVLADIALRPDHAGKQRPTHPEDLNQESIDPDNAAP